MPPKINSSRRFIVFAIGLALFSLACLCGPFEIVLFDPPATETPPPGNTTAPQAKVPTGTIQNYETGSDCPTWMADLTEYSLNPTGGDDSGKTYPTEIPLARYEIVNDNLSNPQFERVSIELVSLQNNRTAHETVWRYFANLIPASFRRDLSTFIIFTDGPGELLASVERSEEDPGKWILSVDIQDTDDPYELTNTLIHEFGHLLTSNLTQIKPDPYVLQYPDSDQVYAEAESACPAYFDGVGCSLPGAYITDFFNQFWPDLYNEWMAVEQIEDEDTYAEAQYNFYEAHLEEFVNEYAATNPDEDIAESWTLFILAPPPEGSTIAEEKILFFHQYPELVQLRLDILANLCTYKP